MALLILSSLVEYVLYVLLVKVVGCKADDAGRLSDVKVGSGNETRQRGLLSCIIAALQTRNYSQHDFPGLLWSSGGWRHGTTCEGMGVRLAALQQDTSIVYLGMEISVTIISKDDLESLRHNQTSMYTAAQKVVR